MLPYYSHSQCYFLVAQSYYYVVPLFSKDLTVFNVLDVGCGNNPRGDVNVDLYIEGIKGQRKTPIFFGETPRFVRADLNKCLPFKENTFKTVLAIHVLEHLENPLFSLREFKRVATEKVIIFVPDHKQVGVCGEHYSTHLYTWSFSSLEKLLSLVFPRVEIYSNRKVIMWNKEGHVAKMLNVFLRRIFSQLDAFSNLELCAICYVV